MSQSSRLQLIGGPGSPYTRKMVALLRYRRIPYNISWGDPGSALDGMGIEKPRPTFMPTFLFSSEEGGLDAVCDSTPIIRRLEVSYPARTVLPLDPAIAFIDYLIEDFADEWCTKYMFHYRWHFKADADNAGTLLPLGMNVSADPAVLGTLQQKFKERQVSRLYVVGSNDNTAPVIDASYRRFLLAMEAHLEQQPFMLGGRPGAGDFALYGQLTQLVGFDPTPREIAHEVSPRTVAWVDQMEDQSGLEPIESDWNNMTQIPDSIRGILNEIGRVYVPALLANAEAVEAGESNWQATIDDVLWVQKTFPYQAKCLNWIREQYRALSEQEKTTVNGLLEGTGCKEVL